MYWLGKFRAVLGLAVPLVAVSCSRSQQGPPAMPVPEVVTVTVAPEPVTLTTELPGRTAAYLNAEIRPQVNGLIEKRLFTEGANVKAGDVLYQIDAGPFQAVFDKASANLALVKSRATRAQELLAAKAVSQQEFDDADAALKQAEADLATARINLGYTKITAPIAGRIGISSVTEGAIVTAYQPMPVATIQQFDPIYVDVPQSTAELLRLQRRLADGRLTQDGNSAVTLFLEDGTKYPLEGTLKFRDISVDPSTATVTLRMVFPNPNGVLLPGMFVRAAVKEGISEQAILIPQQAIMRDPKGNPMALVVNTENKADLRMLTLDRAVGDKWLVTAGLAAGDRVIVEGLMKTRPGMPVKIAPPEGAR
jgi:membrane fusion protein (multidrug efflux system)